MTLTPQQQHDIIEQESAWIDNAFGQVDLSAFPALNPLPPEPKHDDRFAREYGDAALRRSSADLRRFLSDPDAEALEQVGTETGNLDFLADVRDQRAEAVVQAFKQTRPHYLPTSRNFEAMVTTLSYNALPKSEQAGDVNDVCDLLIQRGYFTIENLQAVYDALDREGILDKPAGEPRNLSERERLRVARLAQAGRVDEAIGEYLRCALDGDEPDMSLVHDPKYRGLCNDAVYEVFQNVQLDYVETAARKAYLMRFAGTRPLTIVLLQQAWKSCQENEKRRERSQLFAAPEAQPVTEKQIEALDDSAVERLYHDSLRAYADTMRRAPGILI
jgi:hypothetical protein